MITPLDRADYGRVRPLGLPLAYHLCCAAVLDGHNPGTVLVDDPSDPRSAFIFSPEGSYLVGEPHNEAFNRALHRAFYDRATLGEVHALFFVVHPDNWEGQLPAMLGGRVPLRMERRHYVCSETQYDWGAYVPSGYSVQRIDQALLERAELQVPDHMRGWMEGNWGSTADFLNKGFGVVTIHNDRVVCWSLADCRSGDACEIGIHTLPEYRRLGLGAITAAAAVEHALTHGYALVGWHCNEDNLGSIGTAEKAGFELERRYAMFYAFLDEAVHLAETGYVAFRSGRYEETVDCYERALAMADNWQGHHYHLAARAWAALGQQDKALAYLHIAVDKGWADVGHTESCAEFAGLQGTPEWERVLGRIRQNGTAGSEKPGG